MKIGWGDLIKKALDEAGGEADLSLIYEKVFASPEAKAKMRRARSRTGGTVDFRSQVRCLIQRDPRFAKSGSIGRWKISGSGEHIARAGAVEKIREEIKGTKLKRYRLRKETAILKFFENSDRGTNEQIIFWINKHLKNCHGRAIRHGTMSARECGQILRRMHFIKCNKVWYPPGVTIPAEPIKCPSSGTDRRDAYSGDFENCR